MITHLITLLLKKEVNTLLRCKPKSRISNLEAVLDVPSTYSKSMQSTLISYWTKPKPTQPWTHRSTTPILKCNTIKIRSNQWPREEKYGQTAEPDRQARAWIRLELCQRKFKCHNHSKNRGKLQSWIRLMVKAMHRVIAQSGRKMTCKGELTNPYVLKVFSRL